MSKICDYCFSLQNINPDQTPIDRADLKQHKRFIKFPKSMPLPPDILKNLFWELLRLFSIQVHLRDFDTFISITARCCIEISYDWFFYQIIMPFSWILWNLDNIYCLLIVFAMEALKASWHLVKELIEKGHMITSVSDSP